MGITSVESPNSNLSVSGVPVHVCEVVLREHMTCLDFMG